MAIPCQPLAQHELASHLAAAQSGHPLAPGDHHAVWTHPMLVLVGVVLLPLLLLL